MKLDQIKAAISSAGEDQQQFFTCSLDTGEHYCFPFEVTVSTIDSENGGLIVVMDGRATHFIDPDRVTKILFEPRRAVAIEEMFKSAPAPLQTRAKWFDFRRFWA